MDLLNRSFSHIYIEREAKKYLESKQIIEKFPKAQIVEIEDYKEVFSRNNQNFSLQKKTPKLILAVKKENYLYEGAKVCESFGNENFYYSSSILNCIYDCEYCYLQGVYSSGNIVIFVNLEDMFQEIEEILKSKSMYICISYDTDLMALEEVTGFVKRWYEFVDKHKNLKIELRTKSASIKVFQNLKPTPNFIIAWTISPKEFAQKHERGAVSFDMRIKAAKSLIESGWNIRVCFDPMIKIENFNPYLISSLGLMNLIISGVGDGDYSVVDNLLGGVNNFKQAAMDNRLILIIPDGDIFGTRLFDIARSVQIEANKISFIFGNFNIEIEDDGENVTSFRATQSNAIDYETLTNKPQINGVTLIGSQTSNSLNIQTSYTASDILFSDGESLQYKFDNKTLVVQ